MVVFPAVANIGINPEYIARNVATNTLISRTCRSTATIGDIKNAAPPGIPGDSRLRMSTGGISVRISTSDIGKFSSLATLIVTSMTDIPAQLLFITVPKTMDTSATSRDSPRSLSAETTFKARVSYDPPVPNPVGHTDA